MTGKPGVWGTDAPSGYVGIVVYDAAGQCLVRVDVQESLYASIGPVLREFLDGLAHAKDRPPLALMR